VVRFDHRDNNITYQQVPVHKVINNRQNFIEWSPNARFLALGSEKVTIWQYEAGQFSRYKEFNDELFEVTAFTWCPNSKKYAVSGINLDLSIHVRNIETDEKLKELRN
jgi:WD40 repeat protein